MPRLSLLLLVVALLAAAVGATYALRFNPEMHFWTEAAELKLAWVDQMRDKHGYVIGVVGGSTTTFAIDAETLEREHGLPVANLGLHAGMGPDICAGFGFSAMRTGDTLIVSLEPSMLSEEGAEPTSLGIRMAWALGRPEILDWGRATSPWQHLANPVKLQPGGYHVMTALGKLALNQQFYRYSIHDSRPGGLQTTSERRLVSFSHQGNPDDKITLSHSGRNLLAGIRDEAAARGVNVVYLLPWSYAPQPEALRIRQRNRQLLWEIEQYIPVIEEPEYGVHTQPQDFSDSGQHLTEQAARKRSEKLIQILQRLAKLNGATDS